MNIDFLVNDGSPRECSMLTLMGDDPNQVGVGGSELAMLTLCEEWQKAGHQVRLYNDPRPNWKSPFEQLPINAFNPQEDRDILIVFRSPNLRVVGAKGLKVWFSCDQFTVGSFKDFRPMVDKVVCISPFHAKYFVDNYGINDAIVIDLPVRVHDYENKNIEKVKNRFIFNSVPARGLNLFLEVWPLILKGLPDATLVITADYRLWSASLGAGNEHFIRQAMPLPNISYLGAIPRPRLIEEELKAEVNVYTCNYAELFCIACAENQVAGAYTITSDTGALPTTNMGTVIRGNVEELSIKRIFAANAIEFMNSSNKNITKLVRSRAIDRFHPSNILAQWDERVFKSG